MTLRTRIAAVASVSVALAVLAVAIGLYVAVRSDLRGEIDSALLARVRGFPASRDGGGRYAGGAPIPAGVPDAAPGALGDRRRPAFPGRVEPAPFGAASGYVEFISAAGVVSVPGGQGAAPRRIAVDSGDRAIAARGTGTRLSERTVNGTRLRVLTAGTGGGGAVLIARPLTEVEHELSRLLLILVLIGAGGIVLAALLGTLVARTALKPVSRFTLATETLTGELDLSRRLEVSGRDELGRLAETFNGTLDALERSVAAQRHLIADASHELRTPISSLRANIQVLADADRLSADEQRSLRGDFELDLEPTVVSGAADRIGRAVSNLVENARKFSPEGGVVELSLHDGVLSVRDHGPGFQAADLPFVFDRFYRAEEARTMPGSGLGLAIVRRFGSQSRPATA